MAVLTPTNLSSRDTSVVTRTTGRCAPKITHFSNKKLYWNSCGGGVFLRHSQLLRLCSVGYTHIKAHGPLVEWNGQWKTAVLGENTPLVPLCPPQIPHRLAWEYLLLFLSSPPLNVSTAKRLAQILTLLSCYALFISEICKAFLLASRYGATPGCGQRTLSIRDDPL